jgi:predicted transcriptional regulator
MEAKQTVRALLDRLPDDCSLDELLYHVYVLNEIEKGRADVDAGRTVSHAQVAAELRKKWQHGAEK